MSSPEAGAEAPDLEPGAQAPDLEPGARARGPDAGAHAPDPEPGADVPSLSLSLWSDEALFEQICAGSERHFDVLYGRYFARVYAFVLRRLRNHADAEEVVQETFTVVFRAARGYGGRSSPLAWIYGVARNLVHNHLRRSHAEETRRREAGDRPLVTTSPLWSYGPDEQLALDDCARSLDAQLAALAPWQAEAFFLRHAENLPIGEISRRTERSSDAVRSGLYRVKQLLLKADAWEPEGSSP